jgi:zinc protease
VNRSLLPWLVLSVLSCGKGAPPEAAVPVAAAGPGGITLVDEVTRQGDEVRIPFKRFKLPNGLTVVLHEDDSDPLVHVDVTYHVGSGREDIGKSGFAHFFEHMMFQGSEHVGDEQHFKIITEAGGTLNGTTNTDRTNYFETVPSNQLEKMLWLEADRMGFLLDAVTQEKFEVQRETVKNERGQRVDNAPYGLLYERTGEALYPVGHPYSWSVIGYLEDLDRADLSDLKRFFLRWYGPNNAVLTIGGRFDEAQVLEMVAKYFGPIPAGPEVLPPTPAPVTLDADRYISLEDNVALPLIQMSWPTVYARHADEAPLDVLMTILGDGRTSLLYKNLVKDGVAVRAWANHGCQELACTFSMAAMTNADNGKTLADIEGVLRASLTEFESRGVLDDDLERVKAGIVSDMIFGLESVSGKVSQLAYYETFTGTPDYFQKDIARYEAVTKDDVLRVYKQYVQGKPAVIMSIVPKGRTELIAKPDTFTRKDRVIPPRADEGELALRRPTDTFDRGVMPAPGGENPVVTPPPVWTASMANGAKVLGALNNETPTTAVEIIVHVGQRHESIEQLGLAALTAAMLEESTATSTNEDLSNRLDKLGSEVWVGSYERTTTVTVRSLTKNLDATMAIAAERLLNPGFKAEDFDRVKAQTLKALEEAKTQPSTTASDVLRRLVYGADNSFAHPNDGAIATVQKLTLDDVKAFYAAHYGVGAVMIVSDLPQDRALASLGALAAWKGEAKPLPALRPMPELKPGTLYLVDKPKAAQSEIRLAKRALPYDATGEYYRSGLMNYPLGGAFNSRINLNLREDKGYTYGARAGFRGDTEVGMYSASAGVRSDATAASIVEFVKEIKGFHAEGPNADELAFTRASLGQSEALDYETPSQKLALLSDIYTYQLPDDYAAQQQKVLATVTEAELDALAAKHLDVASMIMVVVGDEATIRPELEKLGYPIVRLDADGRPLK